MVKDCDHCFKAFWHKNDNVWNCGVFWSDEGWFWFSKYSWMWYEWAYNGEGDGYVVIWGMITAVDCILINEP